MEGLAGATQPQTAFVFYDWTDQDFIEDGQVSGEHIHNRALNNMRPTAEPQGKAEQT